MTPLVQWHDGSWIGRLATQQDVDEWMRPLMQRKISPEWWPSLEDDFEPKLQKSPIFLYVDPRGVAQAGFMVTTIRTGQADFTVTKNFQVTDLIGFGNGWILDKLAKRRVSGFVYEDLLPDEVHPFSRGPGFTLGLPWTVENKRFKRSLTSERPSKWTKIRDQWRSGQPLQLKVLGQAVYDHIRRKILAKHFFSAPMNLNSLPEDGYSEGIANKLGQTLYNIPRNERISVLARFEGNETDTAPRKLWWEVRRVIEAPEGYTPWKWGSDVKPAPGGVKPGGRVWSGSEYHYHPEILGRHDQGPLEALHAAGIFMRQSELEGWLDVHADFEGELTFNLGLYEALEVGNPLLWDLARFIPFAEQLAAQ